MISLKIQNTNNEENNPNNLFQNLQRRSFDNLAPEYCLNKGNEGLSTSTYSSRIKKRILEKVRTLTKFTSNFSQAKKNNKKLGSIYEEMQKDAKLFQVNYPIIFHNKSISHQIPLKEHNTINNIKTNEKKLCSFQSHCEKPKKSIVFASTGYNIQSNQDKQSANNLKLFLLV